MLPLITSKVKDDILRWLGQNVSVGSSYTVDMPALREAIGTDLDDEAIEAVLEEFEEMGLLSELKAARFGTYVVLKLKTKAHAFIQQGGFTVEDALNEANIQKILLELDNLRKQLKPDQLDAVNKLTSIASSIATVLSAFSDQKS